MCGGLTYLWSVVTPQKYRHKNMQTKKKKEQKVSTSLKIRLRLSAPKCAAINQTAFTQKISRKKYKKKFQFIHIVGN